MGNNWLGRLEMVELVYSNSPAEQNTEVHLIRLYGFRLKTEVLFTFIFFLNIVFLSFQ